MNTHRARAILLTFVSALLPACAQLPHPENTTTISNKPGRFTYSSVVKVAAEVSAIDFATRRISLNGPDGMALEVVAGDEIRDLAQIAVGDRLNVEYAQTVNAVLRKKQQGEPPAAVLVEQQTDIARSVPGQNPAGSGSLTVTALLDVVAVDRGASTVTIKGPKGNPSVVVIQNAGHFDVIEIGDQVEIEYIEAMAVLIVK